MVTIFLTLNKKRDHTAISSSLLLGAMSNCRACKDSLLIVCIKQGQNIFLDTSVGYYIISHKATERAAAYQRGNTSSRMITEVKQR